MSLLGVRPATGAPTPTGAPPAPGSEAQGACRSVAGAGRRIRRSRRQRVPPGVDRPFQGGGRLQGLAPPAPGAALSIRVLTCLVRAYGGACFVVAVTR